MQKQVELQKHSVAHGRPNEHTQNARAEHKDQCLVEVKHSDAVLGQSHGTNHAHLLLLLIQVS